MDDATKKEVDSAIAAGVRAALEPIQAQLGQFAEAGTKIGEFEKNLKILGDTVSAQKIIGVDDVRKLIGAELTAAQQAAAAKAAEDAKAADSAKALQGERDSFIAEKLKGIPAAYHALLGDVKEKWGEAEKSIRETFAADAKAAGLQVPAVGGSGGGSAVTSTGTGGGGFLAMPGAQG